MTRARNKKHISVAEEARAWSEYFLYEIDFFHDLEEIGIVPIIARGKTKAEAEDAARRRDEKQFEEAREAWSRLGAYWLANVFPKLQEQDPSLLRLEPWALTTFGLPVVAETETGQR
jgi:hypothetical protein